LPNNAPWQRQKLTIAKFYLKSSDIARNYVTIVRNYVEKQETIWHCQKQSDNSHKLFGNAQKLSGTSRYYQTIARPIWLKLSSIDKNYFPICYKLSGNARISLSGPET